MPFLSADRLNGLRGVAPIDQLQVFPRVQHYRFVLRSCFAIQSDADSARKELQRTLRAVSQVRPIFANSTRGKFQSHSFYQRRDAIVQGADNIMKVSNDAAKDFDKTVLAAMLKVPTTPHNPNRLTLDCPNADCPLPPLPRLSVPGHAPHARGKRGGCYRFCARGHAGQGHQLADAVSTRLVFFSSAAAALLSRANIIKPSRID
jgi:hypothetical protein